MPRVLIVNPNHEDYLADGVFHGLRTLLGADAVDFPKAEYMYDTASASALGRVRGGAFTLYGLLPDLPIDRDHILPRALAGEFDLVVFADIWRTFGLWTEWGPQLHDAGVRLAVLDGADRVEPYPYSGLWWRVRAWWFLPRAHNRAAYFKREITPLSRWFASYLLLPPAIGRRLDMRPISFSIPPERILAEAPRKERDFPSHIVDREVADRLGGQLSHVFAAEEDYRADLMRSRFGITTKRAGWDALRHYEIAACGAVPCFRELERKPAGCAPFGLDATNSISYRSVDDLLAQVADLSAEQYARLQAGALSWARRNSTVVRARELLDALGIAVEQAGAG
ncbi:MAG TPA: hypothetical protein VKU89_04100 [Solirubrobacteraceae bacterium]|nr:hypothetical protein [Solirubrobacteraceae bacterium]